MLGPKEKTDTFIITLPLRTERFQYEKLETDFRIACSIYNSLVKHYKKVLNQMFKTKEYRYWLNQRKAVSKIKAETDTEKEAKKQQRQYINSKLKEIQTRFGLTAGQVEKQVKEMQHHFNKNIHSHVAQKLTDSLWNAISSVLYDNGKDIHFKRLAEFNSIEGKNNTTGIVFEDGYLYYGPKKRYKIPVVIDKNNPYELQAVTRRVKYCRIIRKWVRSKYKYYIQLVLEGLPPPKINKNTGEFKRSVAANKRVGIDIGTQTVAVVSDTKVMLNELADKVQNIERKLRLVNRAMDRSRRATNPDLFNEDGTIKRLPKGTKREWVCSNRYKMLASKRRELYRKQAAIRKMQHFILANEILAMGNVIFIENMNFKALQKRAKETTKNEKTGKYNSKKRFGKSLANKAPAMFLTILKQKAEASGGALNKINTKKAKASQFNHLNLEYNKKKLSERWNLMPDGSKIQRDLYSAFLIKNINADLETFNIDNCNKEYESFVKLHDIEIARLRGVKTPSSTGVKKVA